MTTTARGWADLNRPACPLCGFVELHRAELDPARMLLWQEPGGRSLLRWAHRDCVEGRLPEMVFDPEWLPDGAGGYRQSTATDTRRWRRRWQEWEDGR